MTDTVTALETSGLGKRYGRTWGLQDCSFLLPQGRVAALVGPNGSGKSTLLRMAAGITVPTAGEVRVLGSSPQDQTVDVLTRIGYLDQERPLYKTLRVEEMLRFGRSLNPAWDDQLARRYLAELDISLRSRVGKLSTGQQAQVALTLCLAKRPELLLLDEPVAALDPLARQRLMQVLLGSVVDGGITVLLSSHALSDLEVVCDYVIILSASHVQLADDLDRVLATHRLLVGPRRDPSAVPNGVEIVSATHTERQSNWLVRAEQPVTDPSWEVVQPTLEEVVLAYLRDQASGGKVSLRSPSAPEHAGNHTNNEDVGAR
ncbi:MAG TPA: ABC transporter ATP-binding protein [Acidimicrobiales bacterium]|nr:ABC transporter ATP-binding protein [Acidimicrobiales bacterium]